MTAIRDSATQRALSRVLAGEPVRDAARAEGISPHNVYRARAHYEATGRRPQALAPKPPRVDRRGPKPLKPAMARAVERVRSGETAQAAARAEGVDNSRLGRVCKRDGAAGPYRAAVRRRRVGWIGGELPPRRRLALCAADAGFSP